MLAKRRAWTMRFTAANFQAYALFRHAYFPSSRVMGAAHALSLRVHFAKYQALMMTLRIRMFLMRRHSCLLDLFKSDSKSFCFLFEDFVEHDIVSTCRTPNLLTAEARRTARFSLGPHVADGSGPHIR